MQVRIPTFDAKSFRAHWAPNREFAQFYNAFSIVPAHIEPYLIKVMMKAREVVPKSETELQAEMSIFIKQETQHCKQHVTFNRFLHTSGYEGMLPIEQAYKDDYGSFLANKSLKWNLAYCEGFEALGCAAGEIWFSGEMDELLKGADPYATELWKWHLAEEFEHRTVCFDVFKTLHARSFWGKIFNGYFYRIYGFFYAAKHINSYTARCARYLVDKDNEGLSDAERAQSAAREKAMQKAISRATLPKLLKVLSPFYNPRHKRMPSNMSALLDRYAHASPAAST